MVENEVVFEALYIRLRQEGFRTGVDQHLRMQELLDRVACGPQDLKTALCPLFATNPTQQAVFYRVFDEVFNALGAEAPAPAQVAASHALQAPELLEKGGSGEAGRNHIGRLRWILAAVVFICGGLLWLVFYHPLPPPTPDTPQRLKKTPVRVNAPVVIPKPAVDESRTVSLQLPAEIRVYHPEAKQIAFEWSSILTPLLMFGVFLIYRRVQRRMSAKAREKLQEPHFWPLQLEALGSRLFRADEVRELARRMRQREDSSHVTLDIPATIFWTIRGHGFPTFHYRAVRQPPEYVVLLERRSNVDHFTAMMMDLIRILQADGVFISQYYFEGDPRRLFTETGEQLELEYLAARTTECRLLLIGDSGCLFHPLSGKLERWVGPIFENYKFKSILVPDAPRPKRLNNLWESGFAVVAADVAGFRAMLDFFESGGVPAGKAYPVFFALEEPLTEEGLEAQAEPNPQTLWLASCAVYPELNWNLTLRLASTVEAGLVSEREAGKLARMPWLRRGEIPAHWREKLAEWIPEAQRGHVQDSLYTLLKTQGPPPDTFAWEDWQHTVQAFRPPADTWREGVRRLFVTGPKTLAHESTWDMTCLRFLDKQHSGRLAIPDWLRQRVFRYGLGLLGTRARAWLSLAVMVTLMLAGLFRPWEIHEEDLRHVYGNVVDDDTHKPFLEATVATTLASEGAFEVSVASTVLPVTTNRPYWAQRIETVGDGSVNIVVSKQHPQTGPPKIVGIASKQTGGTVIFSVDYTGPATGATVVCDQRSRVTNSGDAFGELNLVTPGLDPGKSHQCSVTVSFKDAPELKKDVTIPVVDTAGEKKAPKVVEKAKAAPSKVPPTKPAKAPVTAPAPATTSEPAPTPSPVSTVTIPDPARFDWYGGPAEDFSAFTGLSMNGKGNSITVEPGASISLTVDWSVGPNPVKRSCPGCIFQVYLGFYDPVAKVGQSWCVFNGGISGPVSGNLNKSFTAPTNPGLYLVTSYEAPNFGCANSPQSHTNNMARAVGAITVAAQ